ncbi:unnamed protein product [Closterium sp. Naga37s-1]|nr:unnamed protein product [Closterium sp. Naga37s-1]
MSIWNYVVTAHKPTAVTHSLVGSFTGTHDMNLIVGKSTRMEIYLLTPQGLQPLVDVPLYGRIATMELFRPPGELKDLLFICTERYKFCVLEYDAHSRELITRANGDVSDRIGRPTDNGQIGIVDPDYRIIGLHLYDGLFKVIPIDSKGHLKEAFNIRLEELQVIDIKFLFACERPTIAVLYQDNKDARHVKTYEVQVRDKDFTDGPWQQSNLDGGAALIIPVPPPMGGALIVGEQSIVYHNGAVLKALPMRPCLVEAYGRVDPDGSRYLLGDHMGTLMLLALSRDKDRVVTMKLETLGAVSSPATISYLDNGVVFLGSAHGDSQLIRLSEHPAATGSYVEEMERFVNLGPIVDMAVVDLDRQGQGQLVTCSGAFGDGSLRVVRNGIGINEQATVELEGIKGMWSLRRGTWEEHDTLLVVTFVSETRSLAINDEDELDETDVLGFDQHAQTLFCGNVVHDQIVQVTSSELRLVNAHTLQQVTEWRAPAGASINVATANLSQVLLATGGGTLVYVEVGEGTLTERTHVTLEHEIACLDVTPITDDNAMADGTVPVAALAAVGMWTDMSVRVLRLPGLEEVHKEVLGGDIIPRSVLMCCLEQVPYLLCALGDGHLFNFHLDRETGQLSDRKKVSLGTQPMTLRTFRSRDTTHVFAASDRPTVVHSSNRKLLYSNVNLKEVTHMCSFNCASFPDSLALAKEGDLTIGSIDDIQKLHIRTVPLREQPRRICHHEQSHSIAVTTIKVSLVNGEEAESHYVRLLSDQTFDQLSHLPLEPFENGCSIISCCFTDDPTAYIVVGTAFAFPDEQEPTKGRILVLAVEGGKLQIAAEKETKGAVYTLNAFNGKVLAGINNKVQLFRWAARDDGARELLVECGHFGHILALYTACRGDFIIVGDLMKSMSLLVYKQEEGALELRARDFNANWMTAVEVVDDDVYIGAENSFNLFTLRKNGDAPTDEERGRLEVVGEYHLGEFVNRFRHGSLVMRLPDSETPNIPTLLFGTVSGAIGVVASLPQDLFSFLHRLQHPFSPPPTSPALRPQVCLTKVIKGVGGLSHAEWRSFHNERKTVESKAFIDGDLVEAFLDLKRERMAEVAEQMKVPLEELCKKVEELTRLH